MKKEEITVLDYLKFKLNPKNWNKEILPDNDYHRSDDNHFSINEISLYKRSKLDEKWSYFINKEIMISHSLQFAQIPSFSIIISAVLAIFAQCFLEPEFIKGTRNPIPAIFLYNISFLLLLIAFISSYNQKNDSRELRFYGSFNANKNEFYRVIRIKWFILSIFFTFIALILFGGNKFTFINLIFWILALISSIFAWIEVPQNNDGTEPSISDFISKKIKSFFVKFNPLQIKFTPWMLLWTIVFLLSVYFRFSKLSEVPTDMFSDHAEKLYDVMDVLDGKFSVFFTRNTGREAFQFYLTALIIKLFGTGVSFLSLKLGTAFAGIFILPYIYLLGKMFGNRWTGLIAMLLTGIAYWPNVISRVALRFALYPMFTAPALYYLFRGFSKKKINDLIKCGIFLGIGLQGYSSMRIVPFVFIIIFLIYFLTQDKTNKKESLHGFLCIYVFMFLAFLPLFRYFLDHPSEVFYRVMTRIGQTETQFTSSPILIFFNNFWNCLIMPFWNDGQIWVHSIVFRPALDIITASFLFIGIVFLLLRYLKFHQWQDLSLLLCIPLLMLPSILSIAFPNENPSLNRTGAAIIPIMIISSFGFCFFIETMIKISKRKLFFSICDILLALSLLIISCKSNYDLVFHRYQENYQLNALNTQQIGTVIKGFAESIGNYENAYVIPYPYWVDTRLVGINAGNPKKDYALSRNSIKSIGFINDPLLFIYKDDDTETAVTLQEIYPLGQAIHHEGSVPGKGFFSYYVPGEKDDSK